MFAELFLPYNCFHCFHSVFNMYSKQEYVKAPTTFDKIYNPEGGTRYLRLEIGDIWALNHQEKKIKFVYNYILQVCWPNWRSVSMKLIHKRDYILVNLNYMINFFDIIVRHFHNMYFTMSSRWDVKHLVNRSGYRHISLMNALMKTLTMLNGGYLCYIFRSEEVPKAPLICLLHGMVVRLYSWKIHTTNISSILQIL